MKIASNKLSDLYTFYKNELSAMYDETELYSIFELVCEKYLNYTKTDVRKYFMDNINQSNLINIYNTAVELKKGLPIQYILKEAFFYDSYFYVDGSVLSPRPETEELVDLILKEITINLKTSPLHIIDMGTGSGCIPITLKKHIPTATVAGIDVSDNALKVAAVNASKHNVNIDFKKYDILNPESNLNQVFNVIVSNPPYIIHAEAMQMDERVLNYEPALALFVDDRNPIIFYKKIIDLCETNLSTKGFLFFELNPLFANDVLNYAVATNNFNSLEIINDMSGKQRFLKAHKK